MKLSAKIIGGVLVFAVTILLSGKGIADKRGGDSVLYGDYFLSLILNCASGPAGFEFNEDLSRGMDGHSYTVVVEAIVSYNRDGTGSTSSHRALQVNHTATGAGKYPVKENECNADHLYKMNEHGTYTVEIAVTCERTAGPGIGQVFTVHDMVREIRAGHGNHTLLITDTKPNVEIVTFPNMEPQERICSASGTAIKIRKDKDGDD